VHLVGGIFALSRRTIGLRLLTGYAVGAIVLAIIDVVYVTVLAPSHYRVAESLMLPHLLYSALALPWPIVTLILVSLRRSRDACR
jgi:hypothetical protein